MRTFFQVTFMTGQKSTFGDLCIACPSEIAGSMPVWVWIDIEWLHEQSKVKEVKIPKSSLTLG